MEPFRPYRPGPGAAPRPVGAALVTRRIGLSVRNLDAPEVDTAALAEQEARERLRLAEEAARGAGFAAGERAGRAAAQTELAALVATTTQAIHAALAGAEAAALEATRAGIQDIASVLLAALRAALPAAAARLAPETAAQVAKHLEPILDFAPEVTLFVAPGLGSDCAAAIGDPRFEVREDPAVAPGDARATWRGGGARSSLAERTAAMANILRAFGLQENEQ